MSYFISQQIRRGLFTGLALSLSIVALPRVVLAESSPDMEDVTSKDGCPRLKHYPLISIPRGTPAPISTIVECPNGSIKTVKVYVRVTEVGKPTPQDMNHTGGQTYEGEVPVSMLAGIDHFWYYIDAVDTDGEAAQSRYHPVQILDPVPGKGAGGAAAGNNWWWWGAGALLFGGATYAILDNNDDGGGGGGGGNGDGNPPPEGTGNRETPCDDSDFIQVFLDNTSLFSEGPILIRVCNACPGVDLRAVGTWGAEDSAGFYHNSGCEQGTHAMELNKPNSGRGKGGLFPGEFRIIVYRNNEKVAAFAYPSESDFGD